MTRSRFILFSFLVCFFLVGFSQPDPVLEQYRRLPLSIRLKRLLLAGKDLYNRRRYEEALEVFKAMKSLDDKNLDALVWTQKCRGKLSQEKNESLKAAIIKKQGSLGPKLSGYENLTWGPTSGHFEVRYSKPKPHIIPPRKIRPRASDVDVAKAMAAAGKNSPDAIFELAMAHKSRGENLLAIKAWEKAVEAKPELLEKDDEGLTTSILEDAEKAMESGNITPAQRVLAAKVSLLQGDWNTSIIQFIRAASKDPSLKEYAAKGLKTIIDSGKTTFLQQIPEVNGLFQAYAYEDKEDRLYLWSNFYPRSPYYVFPFDLEVEPAAIKTIEIKSPDILFIFTDPFKQDTTRLWTVAKDEDDRVKPVQLKAIIHLIPDANGLNLSNFSVESTLPCNWSLVFGVPESFGPGFPACQFEKTDNGIVMKAFQLANTSGKGPTLLLDEFRKPLPDKVNVWKAIDEIFRGPM